MVPDCSADTILACQQALQTAGYVAGDLIGMFSETVSTGLVVQTYPGAGTELQAGSLVKLYVSQGALGLTMFNQAFWGVLVAFSIGIFMGLFIKLTNKS